MSNVSWWLMGLAFVLGVVLTLALTIRRVKREVPVYGALGRGPGAGGAAAAVPKHAASVDDATVQLPKATPADDATTRLPRATPADDATTRLPRAEPATLAGNLDDVTTKLPKVSAPGAVAACAAAAGAAVAAGADEEPEVEKPYGAGSIRTAATATAPEGYPVKGNEDSMLYHTPESPSYQQTIAEIWFVDEESAIQGGFNRWDSGKSQRDTNTGEQTRRYPKTP